MKSFELRKKFNRDKYIDLQLVNDNIYHWNIKFKHFTNQELNNKLYLLQNMHDYKYIEVEFHLHEKYRSSLARRARSDGFGRLRVDGRRKREISTGSPPRAAVCGRPAWSLCRSPRGSDPAGF